MIQKNEKDENDKKQDIGGIVNTITKNETLISNEALNSINIPKKDFEELKNKINNMSQDLEKIKKSNADLSVKFENLTKEFGVENADLEKEIDNIKKNNKILFDNQKKLWNYLLSIGGTWQKEY